MKTLKKYFELWYWALMSGVLTGMLSSALPSWGEAFFMAVMLLPGILFAKFFGRDISFKNRRRGIEHTVWFVGIVLAIEYLSIALVHVWMLDFEAPRGLLLNPLFICFVLASLFSIEQVLKSRFFSADETENQYITFTSDRRKISLDLDTILYVESRDDRVVVVTAGQRYPTRVKISQWEGVLDRRRFVRVHRSFIVGRRHITRCDARTVWIGDFPIEISRKYRENVLPLAPSQH